MSMSLSLMSQQYQRVISSLPADLVCLWVVLPCFSNVNSVTHRACVHLRAKWAVSPTNIPRGHAAAIIEVDIKSDSVTLRKCSACLVQDRLRPSHFRLDPLLSRESRDTSAVYAAGLHEEAAQAQAAWPELAFLLQSLL